MSANEEMRKKKGGGVWEPQKKKKKKAKMKNLTDKKKKKAEWGEAINKKDNILRSVSFILTYYFYMWCYVSGHKMEATGVKDFSKLYFNIYFWISLTAHGVITTERLGGD